MANKWHSGRVSFSTGGRVGLYKGSKGPIKKIGEAISRKWRGKEKTEHKGLEQDKKTGYYTHNAPKDRMDTAAGRMHLASLKQTGPAKFAKIAPKPKSNDMSYKERKKQIAKEKKESNRKKAFDKKHGV
jgi:hypothetical protein